jgi:hypothetical protein
MLPNDDLIVPTHPSYLGDRDQEDHGSKGAQANNL